MTFCDIYRIKKTAENEGKTEGDDELKHRIPDHPNQVQKKFDCKGNSLPIHTDTHPNRYTHVWPVLDPVTSGVLGMSFPIITTFQTERERECVFICVCVCVCACVSVCVYVSVSVSMSVCVLD